MRPRERPGPLPDTGAGDQDVRPRAAEPAPDPAERQSDLLLARTPSVLSLIRLSRRRVFPPGGEELYRHLARMLELGSEHEFVLVPCGRGVTAQYLAEHAGAAGSGVDPDAELVEWAASRAKDAGLASRLHYEQGAVDDLPYQDAVFDVAIGEMGLAAVSDPAAAVRELVRVTKPMGTVVLVQLTWTGNVDPPRREALNEHLGLRPCLLVELKQMLRGAGVVELQVEDWSDAAASLRQRVFLRGLTRVFSVRDRLAVLYRGWQRWGWRAVPRVLSQQRDIRRLILQDRVLGLSLLRGTKWREPTERSGAGVATP